MRLGLGTAQFGQVYGVANDGKAVPSSDVADILAYAAKHDIGILDTATDYGSCESLLGKLGVDAFSVVSKLPGLPTNVDCPGDWISKNLEHSLQRMGLESLYGLLLHRPKELLGENGDALYQALIKERESGRIGKLGVSVYSPDELEAITKRFNVDIVQLPCNVMDRRFLDSGWVERLRANNVEIHVRSAFLQGLLLMTSLPAYFNRWCESFRIWHEWLSDHSVDPVDACLAFLKSVPGLDHIVVGATSVAQLEHIKKCFNNPTACRIPDIGSQDEALVNPSQWVLA